MPGVAAAGGGMVGVELPKPCGGAWGAAAGACVSGLVPGGEETVEVAAAGRWGSLGSRVAAEQVWEGGKAARNTLHVRQAC